MINTAVGSNALSYNVSGYGNSALGSFALYNNSAGFDNTAMGSYALLSNTTGFHNTAVGEYVLRSNTFGDYNSALGKSALARSTSASGNSAVGAFALYYDTTGHNNEAVGDEALVLNTTGSDNIAIGSGAGFNQTTGSNNIYLDNIGVAGESGQIKIGSVGTHTGTTIAGISGATSAGGVAVLVNASGVLGTVPSSARFKQDVHDMGEASDLLMELRPVTFRYREDAVGAEEAKQTQYGLIAEEVAKVAPELVAPGLDGKPYSVKYHELPALLLNEAQKTERQNFDQERRIERQEQVIAALQARLTELELREHDGRCEEVTR